MPDDLAVTGPEDGRTISMNQDHEVRYWCEKFSRSFKCEKHHLQKAVDKVGNRARDVDRWLIKNHAALAAADLAKNPPPPKRRRLI